MQYRIQQNSIVRITEKYGEGPIQVYIHPEEQLELNDHQMEDSNMDEMTQEIAIELTYAYTYNDYLTIHPDVQYIVKPGFSEDLDNALVLTLRLESAISF